MLPLRRERGRPKKDPNAPKARYNLSTAEKARRATQASINRSKKEAAKKQAAAKKQNQRANQRIRAAQKVETALKGEKSRLVDMGDVDQLPSHVKELIGESDVVFQPNAGPQEEFLSAPEQDVLYGGAAGGGKSFALLADPLRYCHNPNHRGLLLRRTLDELTELISKSKQLYPKAFPGATFRESKSTWVFPSGATIWFSYLDKDKDVTRYQGQAFNWIAIDEITQYPTPYVWEYLRSRLRATDPSCPPIYPCVVQQTPAVSAAGGSKKCTSIKESPVSVTFHPTWNRESHTYTRMDMQRQANRSTGESSSPHDSQTTPTSCRTDSMRQCSSHYQRLKENACSMGIGMLPKDVHSQVPQNKTLRRSF